MLPMPRRRMPWVDALHSAAPTMPLLLQRGCRTVSRSLSTARSHCQKSEPVALCRGALPRNRLSAVLQVTSLPATRFSCLRAACTGDDACKAPAAAGQERKVLEERIGCAAGGPASGNNTTHTESSKQNDSFILIGSAGSWTAHFVRCCCRLASGKNTGY